jgi:hypothetical protein
MAHAITASTRGCFILSSVLALAATPTQRCVAGKNRAAGKYAACRQTAAAVRATAGDPARYSIAIGKCESKSRAAVQKLDSTAQSLGAQCPGVCVSFSDGAASIVIPADSPGIYVRAVRGGY